MVTRGVLNCPADAAFDTAGRDAAAQDSAAAPLILRRLCENDARTFYL